MTKEGEGSLWLADQKLRAVPQALVLSDGESRCGPQKGSKGS